MINLTPFLLFDGNCAEAMKFYHSCLGGDLTMTKLGDTPMKDQMPQELHEKTVNAQLKNGFIIFTATDWMHPVETPKPGNMVAMYINSGTYKELRQIFDKLSEGADKGNFVDLRDMPFGSYGHIVDKYAVHWFFQGDKKLETDV